MYPHLEEPNAVDVLLQVLPDAISCEAWSTSLETSLPVFPGNEGTVTALLSDAPDSIADSLFFRRGVPAEGGHRPSRSTRGGGEEERVRGGGEGAPPVGNFPGQRFRGGELGAALSGESLRTVR